jgi:hypothetical protein
MRLISERTIPWRDPSQFHYKLSRPITPDLLEEGWSGSRLTSFQRWSFEGLR